MWWYFNLIQIQNLKREQQQQRKKNQREGMKKKIECLTGIYQLTTIYIRRLNNWFV